MTTTTLRGKAFQHSDGLTRTATITMERDAEGVTLRAHLLVTPQDKDEQRIGRLTGTNTHPGEEATRVWLKGEPGRDQLVRALEQVAGDLRRWVEFRGAWWPLGGQAKQRKPSVWAEMKERDDEVIQLETLVFDAQADLAAQIEQLAMA